MQQTITKVQESSTNISLDDEVLKIFAKMPDALKIEVLHYAEYLLNKGIKKSFGIAIASDDIPKKKYRQAGTMAEQIVMSDDFDEPLAEMQEYMYNAQCWFLVTLLDFQHISPAITLEMIFHLNT